MASSIPLEPAVLTAHEADAMLQRRLKKHHVAIMLLHWFNATTWILELATGSALIVSKYFRFAPGWYVSIVDGVFGDRAGMLRFHVALGLMWVGVFLVYGVFGFRTYLRRIVFEQEMALDADDRRWLLVRAMRILGRSNAPLPPQSSYNAGQKLFGWLVYGMIPVVMLSGVIMTFHLFGTAVVGWAVVAHFAAVGGVVSGLMIHLYMGAVFPEEKSAFFSMLTGLVDELYAYRHHFKWWRRMKLEEEAWMRGQNRAAAAAAQGPGPAEPPADNEPAREAESTT